MTHFVYKDGLTQNVRVAPKAAHPQPVTDDNHRALSVLFLFVESAAHGGAHSKHLEQLIGGLHPGDSFGRAAACDAEWVAAVCRHSGESPALRFPSLKVGEGCRVLVDSPIRARGEQHNQAVRAGEWQRAKQHRVNHGEDCQARSHAQGQRPYCQCRKAGALAETPYRVAQVLLQRFNQVHAAHVAALLFFWSIFFIARSAAPLRVQKSGRRQVGQVSRPVRLTATSQRLTRQPRRLYNSGAIYSMMPRALNSRSICSRDSNCTASIPNRRAPSTYSKMSSVKKHSSGRHWAASRAAR